MRRPVLLWLILAIGILGSFASRVSAQDSIPSARFSTLPIHGGKVASSKTLAVGAAAAGSVPLWTYLITASRDGNTYQGTMVGRSPFFHGARTTNINTVLVPVKITIQNSVFDPTQPDAACLPNGAATAASLTQGSPVLTPASFSMNGIDEGTTQYVDAFQRANFFRLVNPTGDRYHTMFNLTQTTGVISLTMNSPSGALVGGTCKVGVIDMTIFDAMVASTILPNLASQGIGSTSVVVLLLYNVVMTNGSPNQSNPFGTPSCCTIGYHSGLGSLPNLQLYAVSEYDSSGDFGAGISDISSLSHEMAELLDDPLVEDATGGVGFGTPAWGNVGQVSGCQSNLEVGDPLTGTPFGTPRMPNGVTYHPQELAFFSWFFGPPSIGAGLYYSNNRSFSVAAGPICQ